MTTESVYQGYVDFCKRLGILPMPETEWCADALGFVPRHHGDDIVAKEMQKRRRIKGL
jgi:hypothetical protein